MRANVSKYIDICAAETVKNAKRTSAGLNQYDFNHLRYHKQVLSNVFGQPLMFITPLAHKHETKRIEKNTKVITFINLVSKTDMQDFEHEEYGKETMILMKS